MNNKKVCEYRNGVRRPVKGKTAQVWEKIDEYIQTKGYTPTLQELRKMLPDTNDNTIRTNLCQYLHFHGVETIRGDLKNGRSFVI